MRKSKPLLDWDVGMVVKKKSKKPFLNGTKTATITGQCHNKDSGHVAFTFEEFSSCVDCEIVEPV